MRVAAIQGLWQRELLEGRRRWTALLLDLAFGAMNLVVFFFIARTVSAPAGADLDGAPGYFAFAAVGIAVVIVLQSAAAQHVQRVRREQLSGTLEAMVAQPVTTGELALGLTGAGYLLAAVRAVLYLAFAVVALGLGVGQSDPVGVLVMVVLGVAAFVPIGIALLALGLAVRFGEAMVRVLLVALIFLSGTYFPIDRLPAPLRDIATLIPTHVALAGLRHALFRGGDWLANAGWLVVAVAVLTPLSLLVFRAALGSLVRRAELTAAG